MLIPPVSAYTDPELRPLLPSSFEAGVIPRALLAPGERVLFETRPGLVGRYWGRIALLGFFGFSFIHGSFGTPGGIDVAGLVVGGWLPLLIAHPVRPWHRSAYGLTDQRILPTAGTRAQDVVYPTYEQVERLSRTWGTYGGLRFDLYGAIASRLGRSLRGRRIEWDPLSDSAQVYQFIQTSFDRHFRLIAPPPGYAGPGPNPSSTPRPPAGARYPAPPRPAAVTRPPYYAPAPQGGTLRCPACGYPFDPSKLNPALPQCPRCLFILPTAL